MTADGEVRIMGKPIDAPRGSVTIDDDELRRIVRSVAESNIEPLTFDTIYTPVLRELRAQRKYFPGLSPAILWGFYQAVSQVAPIVKKLDLPSLWKEYDGLVWKMVNEQEYDRGRLMAISRILKVNSGVPGRD